MPTKSSKSSSTANLMQSVDGHGTQHIPYGRPKRSKKGNWGARERAGMSFLIVIAFFAVFGLIILTEVFMIDDKSHGVVLRHGIVGRMGDSLPDYDNANEKDDYDMGDNSVPGGGKFGVFHGNKLKIQDGSQNPDIGLGLSNGPAIPWGHVLASNIEETLPHYPGTQPVDGSWQVVNGTRFKFFVFSAFYDRRDGNLIRVIGATKTRGPEKVWCRFWYKQDEQEGKASKFSAATVMARVKIIRENWNLKYSACFVLCPLRPPNTMVPYAVSVVNRLRAPPGNVLFVRNGDNDTDFQNRTLAPKSPQIPDKMAICVKPFHFNYDQALYLLEYIELNAILGVKHFTFYNHTLGPHASCVLQHYVDGKVPGNISIEPETGGKATSEKDNRTHKDSFAKPTVTILPWNLKMRSQKEIRTEGLFAALNDCLYRNMYRYKYLALIDLDEFIIPRHNETLTELLSWINERYRNRNAGAYSFQNSFFYLQFADDINLFLNKTRNPALRASLITQRKTMRRSKLHPQKQRSKYICKPEAVVEAGNHFVWEFVPGKGSLNVPSDAGILHHYRVCEFGGDDCIKAPSTVDRTATKYVDRLVDRVDAVYHHLKKPCGLDDIHPLSPIKSEPTTPASKKSPKFYQNKPIEKEATTEPSPTDSTNRRKKKKIIFFENDEEEGISRARIKYV